MCQLLAVISVSVTCRKIFCYKNKLANERGGSFFLKFQQFQMKQNWYGLQSLHAVTLVCLMNNFHGYLAIPICSTFLAFFSHAEENIELELQAYFKCSTVINLSRRKSITLAHAQIAQVLARRCDFEMMFLQFLIIHFSTFSFDLLHILMRRC